jgi:hypothetical protein
MDIKHYYLDAHEKCGEILTSTLSSPNASQLAKVHTFLSDLDAWIQVVGSKDKCLLEASHKELQMGSIALTMGLYRQSFTSLRFMLERSLAAVKLSTDLVRRNRWINTNDDIAWITIVNEETGIFSFSFADAFFPELREIVKSVGDTARNAYRQCSEYIHGNFSNLSTYQPKFDVVLFAKWLEILNNAKFCVQFSLFLRYWNELDVSMKNHVESAVRDELSHIALVSNIITR